MIDKELNELKPFSDLPDNIDLRSYMLGYLQGCNDSLYKYRELSRIEFHIPLSELNDFNR